MHIYKHKPDNRAQLFYSIIIQAERFIIPVETANTRVETVSFFKRIFRKYKYVLKARNQLGNWEDIEEYDRPVGYAEIADTIEDLKEKGYTYVRFERRIVTDKGEKLDKLLWSKRFSNPTVSKNPSRLTLEDLKTLLEVQKTLKEVLGVKDMSPEDAIANALYWRNVWKELVEEAKKEIGGEKSDIEEIVKIISLLSGLRIPQLQQTSTPSPTPTPMPKPQNITVMENLPPEIEKEVNEIFERAEKKAVEDASKILAPPCVKQETCREEEEVEEE